MRLCAFVRVIVMLLITCWGFATTFGKGNAAVRIFAGGAVAVPNTTLRDVYHFRNNGYALGVRASSPLSDSPINVLVHCSVTRFSQTLPVRGFGTDEAGGGPYDHSIRFVDLGLGAQYEFIRGRLLSPYVELRATANLIDWKIAPPRRESPSPYTAHTVRVALAVGGGVNCEVPNSPFALQFFATYDFANFIGKQEWDHTYKLQLTDGGNEVDVLNFITLGIGLGIEL
jgi:hypothetical protein